MKEKNIRELAKRMGLVTVEDMCQYTIAQLVVKIANKVNELVDEVWRFESDVQEILKTQNENIQYLLGEGLHLELENIFDGWVKDGTFDTLINQTALKNVNDRIDETNAQLLRYAKKEDVAKISSGTPLFVDDISQMNDETRNYVNLSDGCLYTFIGDKFVSTNIKYQEMGISDGQIDIYKTNFIDDGINKFNPYAITIGKRLDNKGKEYDDSDYGLSRYIYVNGTYILHTKSNDDLEIVTHRICHYGLDKVFTSVILNEGVAKVRTLTFDEGYIRIPVKLSHIFDICLIKQSEYQGFTDYYAVLKNVVTSDDKTINQNTLIGKSLLDFGDSIAYGAGNNKHGYSKFIRDEYNMTLVTKSNGGATIARTESNNILDQVSDAITNQIKADYILFDGGTNDIKDGLNIQLGDIENHFNGGYDEATFSGAFEQICYLLKTNYPQSKIIYVRAHNMSSRDYNKQIKYGNRALEICEKWSIPVADVYKEGTMNTWLPVMRDLYTYDTYSTGEGDKTHPNKLGYENCYVPLIVTKMKGI